jgi:glycosyltransferase involved in cell wall biosynthesis
MKKILYIVSTLKHSGPTNQLCNIIKYLDREEFEPHLITLSPEPAESRWADCETLGVHLYSLGLSRFQGFVSAKKRIKTLMTEIKPDVIHTQGIRADIISSMLQIDIQKVATIRNLPQFDYIMTYGQIMGRLMCMLHISALKKISLCIGVSEAVTNNLKNKYKIQNVSAIQNGVDTNIYFPSGDSEKKLLREKLNLHITGNIFISSGHLSELKDPLFLIIMWNKKFGIHKDNHLILIGAGNLLEKCRQEARNNKNIHIIGRVNNVADYLRCSDYYVSVSHAEGLPNAVLEAMACGLPVLLSDIEPHKEILALASGAGFCYELGNEADLLNILNKIANMDKVTMSKNSQEAVKNHFNAKKMSEMYQQIYRKQYLPMADAA